MDGRGREPLRKRSGTGPAKFRHYKFAACTEARRWGSARLCCEAVSRRSGGADGGARDEARPLEPHRGGRHCQKGGDWRGPSDQPPFVCRCKAHFGRKTVRLRVPTKHFHTVTGSPRRWDCMTLRAQYPAEKGSLDASISRSDGLRDLPRGTVGGAGRASHLRRKPQAYGCYKKEAILVLSASLCRTASPVSLSPPRPAPFPRQP